MWAGVLIGIALVFIIVLLWAICAGNAKIRKIEDKHQEEWIRDRHE